MIALTNDKHLLVQERAEEVIDRVVKFRRRILGDRAELRTPLGSLGN
ncbi:MAG: flagellar FlbD family protein [Acidobacteriota bacterium]